MQRMKLYEVVLAHIVARNEAAVYDDDNVNDHSDDDNDVTQIQWRID